MLKCEYDSFHQEPIEVSLWQTLLYKFSYYPECDMCILPTLCIQWVKYDFVNF